MRAFRIGYVVTLSFLLLLMVITLTLGYFPPPQGPKAPEYPSSSRYPSSSGTSYDSTDYSNQQRTYNERKKQYDEDQKRFLQDKIVPYTRNIFVSWIFMLVLFEVIGIVLVRSISEVVGAAYAFSGVWAVVFGPFGGLLWFINSIVSNFGTRAEQKISTETITTSIGMSALLGVIVLTTLGIFYFKNMRETHQNLQVS